MATLGQIRDAIKATLEEHIPGLRTYDTIPDQINPPAVVVAPAEETADFLVAMARGIDQWNLDVLVLVANAVSRTAQNTLDDYVTGAGPKSIRQVFFQHADLGLQDTEALVTGLSKYDFQYDVAGIQYAGATFRVIVRTDGTT